jgi:hypothetical protein
MMKIEEHMNNFLPNSMTRSSARDVCMRFKKNVASQVIISSTYRLYNRRTSKYRFQYIYSILFLILLHRYMVLKFLAWTWYKSLEVPEAILNVKA